MCPEKYTDTPPPKVILASSWRKFPQDLVGDSRQIKKTYVLGHENINGTSRSALLRQFRLYRPSEVENICPEVKHHQKNRGSISDELTSGAVFQHFNDPPLSLDLVIRENVFCASNRTLRFSFFTILTLTKVFAKSVFRRGRGCKNNFGGVSVYFSCVSLDGWSSRCIGSGTRHLEGYLELSIAVPFCALLHLDKNIAASMPQYQYRELLCYFQPF